MAKSIGRLTLTNKGLMDCEHSIVTKDSLHVCDKCGKLAVKLSATALGTAGCLLRFERQVIHGYREKASAARLVYGISVHKFVDTMFKTLASTGDEGQAFAMATKKAKNAFALPKIDDNKSIHLSDERHMLNTCFGLWGGWIADDKNFDIIQVEGKPLTEVTFEILFYEDEFVIVYIAGTIDKLGQFRGGCYAIGDWKTTSSWDNPSYFKQFDLSRQLRMYRLACIIEAERNPSSILGKIGVTNMGVFIDAIFVKPNANENIIRRSDVFQFRPDDMKEFRLGLELFCIRLSASIQRTKLGISAHKEGIVNGSCEGKWGKCMFWHVCMNDDKIGKILLDRDFIKQPFEPADYNNLGD